MPCHGVAEDPQWDDHKIDPVQISESASCGATIMRNHIAEETDKEPMSHVSSEDARTMRHNSVRNTRGGR